MSLLHVSGICVCVCVCVSNSLPLSRSRLLLPASCMLIERAPASVSRATHTYVNPLLLHHASPRFTHTLHQSHTSLRSHTLATYTQGRREGERERGKERG